MPDYSQIPHHPAIEEVTDVLCNRTQNNDRKFFRIGVAYMLSVMAASMRARMSTNDRGEIPVNSYALALSPSGTGKGFSIGILEEEFMKGFRTHFMETTLPTVAEQNMWKLAMNRAARKGTEEDAEFQGLEKEYHDTGAFPFVFDSGSSPAVKQVRQKCLISGAGAINLQIDEIGSNLMGSVEVLNTFLELYDQGKVKQKLTKNTSENKRTEEIEGKTPANMLLFGTPSKLLDGGATEDAFFSFLETGYARRCIFAMGAPIPAAESATPAEIYKRLCDPLNHGQTNKWATHFTGLADPSKFDWLIDVPDDVSIELLTYRIDCEKKAAELPEFDEIRKAEMSHRYFKALKLAGALAFVDEVSTMQMAHLHSAMRLVEESGEAFQSLLQREKAYMKLARYLAGIGTEQTHADLDAELPFYKSGIGARNELMTMATALGYKQHIVIRKTYVDGIEFFSGESLKETSLDEMTLSYSDDYAYHYEPVTAPFDQLHKLTGEPGLHWANHRYKNEHRTDENAIPGFNMVVLDIDGGTNLTSVHDLLQDYTFMTHTTKRHTDADNRFRLILPMSYELKLDKADYKEFMENVAKWLPFEVDVSTFDRSRKWATCGGSKHHYNITDKLLDVLPFVPKTSKNEGFAKQHTELESLDNLERWFAQRIATGNRNNQMLKFALALVDSGMGYAEVEEKVLSFNKKLKDSLDADELQRTVLVTVARKLQGTP
jgi:hypothetical protein